MPILIELDPISEEKSINILKRQNGYLLIQSRRLRFLDMIKFTGKISLRALLSTYTDTSKSHFPYDSAKTIQDLKKPLPAYEDFRDSFCQNENALDRDYSRYNQLLGEGMSEQKALKLLNLKKPPTSGRQIYEELLSEWKENDLRTLGDVMEYYCRGDVVNLLKYAETFFEKIWIKYKLLPARELVSLPQMSLLIAEKNRLKQDYKVCLYILY